MTDAMNIGEKLDALYEKFCKDITGAAEHGSPNNFWLGSMYEYQGARDMAENVLGYVIERDKNGHHTVSLEPDFTVQRAKSQPVCECCKKPLASVKYNGRDVSPMAIAASTEKRFGKILCWDCATKQSKEDKYVKQRCNSGASGSHTRS